jgi:hypothetical protein
MEEIQEINDACREHRLSLDLEPEEDYMGICKEISWVSFLLFVIAICQLTQCGRGC